jgi:hypothetical protein
MSSMRFRTLLLTLLPLALFAAACGGGSAKSTPTASAAGPAISDEAYLKLICVGTSNVSNAVIGQTSAEGISNVIKDFRDSMKAINPPADLREFQTQFVSYLDAAVANWGVVVNQKPPVPSDSVRQRLASKEPQVPECKDPTFFDAGATPAGTATAAK